MERDAHFDGEDALRFRARCRKARGAVGGKHPRSYPSSVDDENSVPHPAETVKCPGSLLVRHRVPESSTRWIGRFVSGRRVMKLEVFLLSGLGVDPHGEAAPPDGPVDFLVGAACGDIHVIRIVKRSDGDIPFPEYPDWHILPFCEIAVDTGRPRNERAADRLVVTTEERQNEEGEEGENSLWCKRPPKSRLQSTHSKPPAPRGLHSPSHSSNGRASSRAVLF